MGLKDYFKNIFNLDKIEKLEQEISLIKSNVNIPLTDPKTFYSSFQSFFDLKQNKNQVSWVYDCVDIWGKHFAGVKFRLYEDTGRDDEKEEITKHPICEMFKKPNEFQTWWDIKYRFAPHWAFYGNVYLYKLRNGFGLPMGLIQLLPGNVTAMPSNSGGIHSYQYNTGATVVNISAKDVIHIPYPDGESLTQGRAIVSNIANEVEVRQFQSAYEKEFYKQGGFLGQVFTTPQVMNQSSFDRAEKTLQAKYSGGVSNSYKTALFDSGLEPKSSPFSIRDMDIKNLKDSNRDEICAAFQVNKFMFGMAESINRATAQEISLQFSGGVVEPLMDYADIILTQKLAMEFGKSLSVEHDNTSPRDQDGENAWYESMTNTASITPNEIRQFEGMDIMNDPRMDVPIHLENPLSKQKITDPAKQTVN